MAVSLAIEGELNTVQKELNKESEGLAPFPAKVEWVTEKNADSFCDAYEDKVVIRMKEPRKNARNVAWATLDYVTKGMIPYSRPYLDAAMSKAVDFTMAKKILSGNNSATDYLYREVVVPETRNVLLRNTMILLENLEKRGMFTRIFLNEVKEIGLDSYPNPDPVALSEIREFAQNLNVYATRSPGDRRGEPYIRSRIKVGLVLLLSPITLLREGATPYITWAGTCITNGASAIYILSRSDNNVDALRLAERIARAFGFEIKNVQQFGEEVRGKVEKSQCILLGRR